MSWGPLESETCREVILPALAAAGWAPEDIRPEFPVAAGKVLTSGGVERALPVGRIDYVLEVAPDVPGAVVEAKRSFREAADGLQQATRYAEQLAVPLAYASNGTQHIERNLVTGTERFVTSFMTPAEVWGWYAEQQGLDEDALDLLGQPFNRSRRTVSGDVVQPRWYQAAAVHRLLGAMARGQRRILVLMATGTGKTFTAMQIVHKLRAYEGVRRPDRNYRVLYLADRDVLVKDPMNKDFSSAFGTDPLHRVSGTATRAREIYFATYQSMTAGDETSLFAQFPADFFDLVVVDECHRGSASENSSWRAILEHFDAAVQLGLTATPKQDDTVDTYRYFGEPVFSYTLRQGIEDGYLAPYRVRRVVLSPDADGWGPSPGQLDRFGKEIPEGRYATRDFERVVRLLARTDLVGRYLSRVLRERPGRMIVFCVDQQHADEMRRVLANLDLSRTRQDPEWVVRIVGAEEERVRLLESFMDPERDSPLVATTSRLLSTGVDIEDLRYVVIFRPVGSAVEFKQIVGRGTRLYPDKGKTSFEIIDFVGATAHFRDPDFDGFPEYEIVDDVESEPGVDGDSATAEPRPVEGDDIAAGSDPGVSEPVPPFTATDPLPQAVHSSPEFAAGGEDGTGEGRPARDRYVVDGGSFRVLAESVQVPDTSSGKLVLTEYGEFVRGRIRRLAPSAAELAGIWSDRPTRKEILSQLATEGIMVADLLGTDADVDPLDALMALAWDQPTRTRAERARRARERHHADLEARSELARAVLDSLLDRYATHGLEEITSPAAARVPPLVDLGSPRQLAAALGTGGLHGAVDEVQRWLYSDEQDVS